MTWSLPNVLASSYSSFSFFNTMVLFKLVSYLVKYFNFTWTLIHKSTSHTPIPTFSSRHTSCDIPCKNSTLYPHFKTIVFNFCSHRVLPSLHYLFSVMICLAIILSHDTINSSKAGILSCSSWHLQCLIREDTKKVK